MENSDSTMPFKKKNDTLNFMKGIVIVAIVLAHIIFLVDKEDSGEKISIALGVFYMCLMSFFIMSGYFFNPERGYSDYVKRRFKQIVIPMSLCIAILPLILYAYLYIVGQPQQFSDYTNNIINFLLGESCFGVKIDGIIHENIPVMISLGYYFLMTMFSSFLLFYAIANKVTKDPRLLIATIAILLVIQAIFVETIDVFLPYFLHLVPIATAFMLVGSWASKNRFVDKMESYGWKDRRVICCFLVSLVICIILVTFFRPTVDLNRMRFGEYGGLSVLPYFITGVLSFVWFFCASILLSKIKIFSRMFIIAGTHTLAIILLHEFIIKLLISPFYTLPSYPLIKTFPAMPIGVAIIVGILAIVIAVVMAVIFEKMRIKWKTTSKQI